jgi:hypothetical protein
LAGFKPRVAVNLNSTQLTRHFLRRTLSVCAVKAQAFSLLGRLESLSTGTSEAAKRRSRALQLERVWGNLRRAHTLSVKQGQTILRRGQFKMN